MISFQLFIGSLELMFYLMKTLTFSGLSPQNTLGRQRSKADRSPYENYPLPLRGSQSPRTHIKTILPSNNSENNANEIYQVIMTFKICQKISKGILIYVQSSKKPLVY